MSELKHKVDTIIGKALLVLETLIAIIAMVVLVILLVVELAHMVMDPSYFLANDAVTEFLHEILSIVVGLEFVKLLLHLTPANILEVLTMAIARGIIVSHGSAVDNLLSIACIIGMFAARRFLIPRNELYQEMDDSGHHGGRKHRHGRSSKQDDKSEEKQEAHQG